MTLARVSMGALFMMLALTKVLGYPIHDTGSCLLANGATVFELMTAIAFFSGRVLVGAMLGTVFFLAALVFALVDDHLQCGCLGGWIQLRGHAQRVTAAALGGLLCSATWWSCAASARKAGGQ